MRLARVEIDGSRWLARLESGARDAVLLTRTGLEELLREGVGLPRSGPERSLGDSRVVAPLRPSKIVAIGLNYKDHIREAGLEVPKEPFVFAKFPSSITGHNEEVRINREVTARVDWEVELGVVVGRQLKGVDSDEALSGVFGYTVANDISARDLQFGDGQWVRGKSMDTFCPLGPVVVTADQVPNPQALRMRTRVNGETMQDASTGEMVFSVGEILSFCSQSFTLEPGDLILTGTPWGCGEFMNPKRSLQPGDVVEVGIDGIGTLRNPVV